ncbi:MAG: AMP-binding protein [Alphaproteobacteria bacterium]|nr:AMP-binding protein [Alphaproteobacteria bacterium]
MPVPPLPFLDFLDGALTLDGTPVLCDDTSEGWMRYGELRELVKKLVPFWHKARETGPKSLILLALPRTKDGAAAYLSAAASGHALLLIDPASNPPAPFIRTYEPDWVLLPSSYRPEGPYSLVDFPLTDFQLWQRTTVPVTAVHPDLFLLLLPPAPADATKTVRLSYDAIAHNTRASIKALGFMQDTRGVLLMPFAYSFGLSLLHMTLTAGASLMLSELALKNRLLWETIQRRDVNLFAGVPFHFEYLARAGLDNLRVPRLKNFLQAGGRMSLERTQDMLRQITARAGQLFILYGLTEAAPRITCLPLHERPEKIGSVGQVLEGGSLTLVDGQLVYQGPNVMLGYAQRRADLAKGNVQYGTLPLPEAGRLDEEGFLFFGS